MCAWRGLSPKPYTPMSPTTAREQEPVPSYYTMGKPRHGGLPSYTTLSPTSLAAGAPGTSAVFTEGAGAWAVGAICLPSCHLLLGPRAVRSRPHTKPGPQASRGTPSRQLQSMSIRRTLPTPTTSPTLQAPARPGGLQFGSIRTLSPELAESPQVKGSVPGDGPHFRHQSQVAGLHTPDRLAINRGSHYPPQVP